MKKCPECKTELAPVQVIEKGNAQNFSGFDYVLEERAKSSFLDTRTITNSAGSIHAYLCDQCHRVLFYATPGVKAKKI